MGHIFVGATGSKNKSWFRAIRFKNLFLITTFCSTGFFLILVSRTNYIIFYHYYYGLNGIMSEIKMEGCRIPVLNPMDKSIKKFVQYPKVPICLDTKRVPLDNNRTHIWIKRQYRDQFKNLLCCYQSFTRPVTIKDINKNVDDRVAFNTCRNFSDTIDIRDEFLKVKCNITNSTIHQFFFIPPKKKFTTHGGHELFKNATAYNVLILGIDAVSRLNLYRTMPKTIKYLKNKGAVDLSGYNKVGDNTFPNLIPMLLGISTVELPTTCLPYKGATFDNCPFVWEWYKQAGFYTALGEDNSLIGTFNYLRAGFTGTPTDYYLHTFIHVAEKYVKNLKHHDFPVTNVCLNEKYFYKILLEYVENLTVTLNSSRLFGFFWEITMSHDNLNYPMIMDNDYVHFFQKLENSGFLNNSVIFLLSDHGIRWGDIRYTKQGRIEERLPFVFALMPPNFRYTYSEAFKNLQFNSNRLTTPFDVHATLLDLIKLENINNTNIQLRSKESYGNNRGISLFLPIPSNRTCEMAHISDHWCTCHKGYSIAKNSIEALKAANYLVDYLNNILIDHPKCATLLIAEIMEATEMVVGKPDNGESGSWREFILTVKTTPGGGIFEATVRNSSSHQWSVSGTVSRLNLYGDQSVCVQDNLLKLYCYCT